MLDNDLIRTLLLFLLIALFFWLLLKFLFDWQKDERVRVRKSVDKEIESAAEGLVDDLTKVEGIGPKISELLNDAGIVSFADLESTNKETLGRLLAKAGNRYRMHDPASWPEQAALANSGDWGALEELQSKLTSGRK